MLKNSEKEKVEFRLSRLTRTGQDRIETKQKVSGLVSTQLEAARYRGTSKTIRNVLS